MHITILAIGRQHESHVKSAVELYETRLKRFAKLEWELIPHAGSGDAERLKTLESDMILDKLKPSDTIVLLDERGEMWDSLGFARRLDDWQAHSRGRLVCIIGGAYGVDARVADRADAVWSLSRLVFPHQLVRVLLCEQLYRAYTINGGLPYHHQ